MNFQRALVTGGGQRLGRAMALYLARRGCDVAVHFNTTDPAPVLADIRAMERKAVGIQADLLNENAVQRLLPQAAQALGGPVDLLVNNASIFERDTMETATRESWDRHMESNLRAPFVLLQALAAQAPRAVPDENGEPLAQALAINMIDQRVRRLTPDFTSYTIAKMGLWALTQTAAQALAPDVRVNAIGPGPTLQGVRQSDEQFARQRAATILKRGADVAGITAALGYFMDAPAVTGQLLCIDGGQHLAWETPDAVGVE